jgi:hypothetical protein
MAKLNMNATPDTVWALLQETSEQMKAMSQETDNQIADMARAVKELSENIGGVNNSLGDIAEGLMASDLHEKFAALGLVFEHSFKNYEVKEKKTQRKLAEADILLANGTTVMVVVA